MKMMNYQFLLLDNDDDPEDDPIKVNEITEDPQYGDVTITDDDTITYNPTGADEKCERIAGQYPDDYLLIHLNIM